MTTDEAAWVAGIIEGEGCFDGNQNGTLRLRVQMVDEDVVRRLRVVTGVGTVRADDRNHRRNPKWSRTFVWSVCKKRDLERLLPQVLPWLGKRRSDKVASICQSSVL